MLSLKYTYRTRRIDRRVSLGIVASPEQKDKSWCVVKKLGEQLKQLGTRTSQGDWRTRKQGVTSHFQRHDLNSIYEKSDAGVLNLRYETIQRERKELNYCRLFGRAPIRPPSKNLKTERLMRNGFPRFQIEKSATFQVRPPELPRRRSGHEHTQSQSVGLVSDYRTNCYMSFIFHRGGVSPRQHWVRGVTMSEALPLPFHVQSL